MTIMLEMPHSSATRWLYLGGFHDGRGRLPVLPGRVGRSKGTERCGPIRPLEQVQGLPSAAAFSAP